MSRRSTGAIFCIISAMLYLGKYLCTVIYAAHSNSMTYGEDSLNMFNSFVGLPLVRISIISLIIGIVYLALAEIEELFKK